MEASEVYCGNYTIAEEGGNIDSSLMKQMVRRGALRQRPRALTSIDFTTMPPFTREICTYSRGVGEGDGSCVSCACQCNVPSAVTFFSLF